MTQSATNILTQVVKIFERSAPVKVLDAKNVGVVTKVGSTDTILDLPVSGMEQVFIQVVPTTNAFDAFQLTGYATLDSPGIVLSSQATDYSNAVAPVIKAGGALVTLAAAASGWVLVDVRGLVRLTVEVSSGTGDGTATIYAGGR